MGTSAVFQNQFAGGRRADAEFVFFLADGESREVFLDQKCGDAFVAGAGVDRREEHEQPRFFSVGDPELAAVQDVLAAFQCGAGLQGERVGARAGFAKGVGADRVGGHLGQEVLFLLIAAPTQERVIDQRILHVDDHAGGCIHARQFFDGQDRFEELGGASAVLLGNLNAHQAELEEIVDEIFVEDALLVHLLHQRTDLLVGELADVVAEENFIFGERGSGAGERLQSGFGHGDTFREAMRNF